MSQIREIISNVNKQLKIRSAVWVWQWPCGLGAGPPREREFWVQDPVETLFIQACLKSRVCFLHQPGHICC